MGQSKKKTPAAKPRARRTGVLDKRFQANLRRLREARGLNQRELADEMKWPNQNYVSQLETGIRGFRPVLVVKLAAFFNVDPSEFFQPEPRRRPLRMIFDPLPEEKRIMLRGTGICEELIDKFEKQSRKELR